VQKRQSCERYLLGQEWQAMMECDQWLHSALTVQLPVSTVFEVLWGCMVSHLVELQDIQEETRLGCSMEVALQEQQALQEHMLERLEAEALREAQEHHCSHQVLPVPAPLLQEPRLVQVACQVAVPEDHLLLALEVAPQESVLLRVVALELVQVQLELELQQHH